MWRVLLTAMCIILVSGSVSADTFTTENGQFKIDFVNISGDTNPALSQVHQGDLDGFGIVDYDYRIGVYEVTNSQFDNFTENFSIFKGQDVPVNNVTWFQAARFVNFLNISSGHQPAYNIIGADQADSCTIVTWDPADAWNGTNLFRHKDAVYFLPTEDEWFKAAYFNGSDIQDYAAPDNTLPLEDVQANYEYQFDARPWNVGSGLEELNGTFDMMGNLWEWVESPYYSADYASDAHRVYRGGSCGYSVNALKSSYRIGIGPNAHGDAVGFRVASVPEPASMVLLSIGGLILRRRNRK